MDSYSKTQLLIDASKVTTPVTIIGAGAVGSQLVDYLVCSGWSSELITVYDFDTVSGTNVQNQLYGYPHVDMPKVEALNLILASQRHEKINIVNERYEKQPVQGFFVLALDTLEGRNQIPPRLLKYNLPRIWDARVGISHYEVRNYPNTEKGLKWFLSTVPKEEDLESNLSACGTTSLAKMYAAGAASTIACQLVHEAKRVDLKEPNLGELPNEVISTGVGYNYIREDVLSE